MGHFVDEETLQGEALFREVFRPQMALGMEIYIAGRRHDDSPRLERPPFASDELHSLIVDCIAENGAGEGDFA